MRYDDIDCPPYVAPAPLARIDGKPPTMLDYASHAAMVADRYQRAMDGRADFDTVLRAAGAMYRATTELATAVADHYSEGN